MTHTLGQAAAPPDPHCRCRANLFHKAWAELFDSYRNGAGRLGNEIDSANLKGRQCFLRALFGQRRHHDDRAGVLEHDAVETGQAVHQRHMDVERHHVRPERRDDLQRLCPVACKLDLEISLGREDLAEQLPHQRGVFNDEEADHGVVTTPSLPVMARATSRSARVRSSCGSISRIIRPSASICAIRSNTSVLSEENSGAAERASDAIAFTSETLSTTKPA